MFHVPFTEIDRNYSNDLGEQLSAVNTSWIATSARNRRTKAPPLQAGVQANFRRDRARLHRLASAVHRQQLAARDVRVRPCVYTVTRVCVWVFVRALRIQFRIGVKRIAQLCVGFG